MTEFPRRKFIVGMTALFAAPAIVRASSLMPFRSAPMISSLNIPFDMPPAGFGAELSAITRRAFLPAIQVQTYFRSPLVKIIGAIPP